MSSSGSNREGNSNSNNSKSKGKKRSRSVECMTCRNYGRTEEMTTHETQYCVKQGGRFANDPEGSNAARKAAEKSSRKKQQQQPASATATARDVDSLKDSFLQQSQIISDAEKRIGSVVKRMEKLEQRVRDLEWDNWKSRSELLQWNNWYDVNFGTNSLEDDLDSWFFNSFAFSQQGVLSIETSPALARYRINTNTDYGR